MVNRKVRWFGTSWGAPACHPDYQMPVPQGADCDYCSKPFMSDSQGFAVPDWSAESAHLYHLLCFNKLIVGEQMAEFIERTRSGDAGEEVQQEAADPGESIEAGQLPGTGQGEG